MARVRDYSAEYARRQARAQAQGFKSFFQKRVARELEAPPPIFERTSKQEAQRGKAYRALLDIEKGIPLSSAARQQGTTPAQVRKYLGDRLEQKGRQWRLSEDYLERQGMAQIIITPDGQKPVYISDPATRNEYATYSSYVAAFLYSLPDTTETQERLNYFKGRTFTDANGQKHVYITDGKLLKKLYDDGKLNMEDLYVALSR